MAGIPWTETPDQCESLPATLRAVFAHYGSHRPYDSLLAALGLGMLIAARPDEPLRCWPSFGRDARLPEAAALFGLRLRALHPANAADGLGRSPEFALHFHDSYQPLIRAALDHRQPVIAWRGWPAPSSRCWGLIAAEREGTLFGYTLFQNGNPVPLLDPAHQVFVIEDYQPPRPPPTLDDILTLARRNTVELWHGLRLETTGLLSGPRAYQAWSEYLRRQDVENSSELGLLHQHRLAVQALLAARRSLIAFLHRFDPAIHPLAARWAQACEKTIEILRPYECVPDSSDSPPSPKDIENRRAALEAACENDSQTVSVIADG